MRLPVPRARVRVLLLGLLSAALLFPHASAEEVQSEEQAVATSIKSAFIRYFCTYIDWPDSAFATPESPIVIGVIGSEAMADTLHAVVGNRTAHGRAMEVRLLDPDDPLDALHLLFVADAMRKHIPGLAAEAAAHGVPVITESPGGLEAGGAFNFIIEDDRVKFDISPAVIRSLGLDVSAQLFTVARVIRKEAD